MCIVYCVLVLVGFITEELLHSTAVQLRSSWPFGIGTYLY